MGRWAEPLLPLSPGVKMRSSRTGGRRPMVLRRRTRRCDAFSSPTNSGRCSLKLKASTSPAPGSLERTRGSDMTPRSPPFAKTGSRTQPQRLRPSSTIPSPVDAGLCPLWPGARGRSESGQLQYFPKGTNRALHPAEHVTKVVKELNDRPRKTLGYDTPTERFNACLLYTSDAADDLLCVD